MWGLGREGGRAEREETTMVKGWLSLASVIPALATVIKREITAVVNLSRLPL